MQLALCKPWESVADGEIFTLFLANFNGIMAACRGYLGGFLHIMHRYLGVILPHSRDLLSLMDPCDVYTRGPPKPAASLTSP